MGVASAVRLISSQLVLYLPTMARKMLMRAEASVVVVAEGVLNGEPCRAILDGHHSLIAALLLGVEPVWQVERIYADEREFREYLALLELTAQTTWFDLASGISLSLDDGPRVAPLVKQAEWIET